jgi:hypothetical protein
VSWQDFDINSALERDTLERALPLVQTESTGTWGAVLNMTGVGGPGHVTISMSDTFGTTPEACIDLLRLRPLLFGTAWRVLDLLLDGALLAAGEPPERKNGGWWIETKVKKARSATIRPTAVSARAWQALISTYVATVELRHCLVHRGVSTDSSAALAWHDDKQGKPGRPVTQEEQEAFARAVLRAAQLVIAPVPEERFEDDLVHQLGLLTGVHKVALGQAPRHLRLSRITAIIGASPATPGSYVLDVPAVKAQSPWPDAAWID